MTAWITKSFKIAHMIVIIFSITMYYQEETYVCSNLLVSRSFLWP